MKRGRDVCVAHPFHVSPVSTLTEWSPFSHSLGGCPCGQVEGRTLEQEYLCESACHWWLGADRKVQMMRVTGFSAVLFMSARVYSYISVKM